MKRPCAKNINFCNRVLQLTPLPAESIVFKSVLNSEIDTSSVFVGTVLSLQHRVHDADMDHATIGHKTHLDMCDRKDNHEKSGCVYGQDLLCKQTILGECRAFPLLLLQKRLLSQSNLPLLHVISPLYCHIVNHSVFFLHGQIFAKQHMENHPKIQIL